MGQISKRLSMMRALGQFLKSNLGLLDCRIYLLQFVQRFNIHSDDCMPSG